MDFLKSIGIKEENIRLRDHEKEELSHYSNATTDIEFLFPFGWGELWGIADRTDFDLSRHMEHSGEKMEYDDPVTHEKYVPYCIEPSLGLTRLFLAVMADAYDEEVIKKDDGSEDKRTVMRFHPVLAPVKAAVLPLTKKLADIAEPFHEELTAYFNVEYDVAGSIGKRYRRQDEAGTPFCICVDEDTREDGAVTIRDRDTMEQIRIDMKDVRAYIEVKTAFLA